MRTGTETIFKEVKIIKCKNLKLFIKIFSWLGVRYFPEYVGVWDVIPLSFLIGLIGIGNVVDVIAKKYGIKADTEDLTHDEK